MKKSSSVIEATEVVEAVEVIEAAKVSHARKSVIMESASYFFILEASKAVEVI